MKTGKKKFSQENAFIIVFVCHDFSFPLNQIQYYVFAELQGFWSPFLLYRRHNGKRYRLFHKDFPVTNPRKILENLLLNEINLFSFTYSSVAVFVKLF